MIVSNGECRLYELGSRNGTFVEQVRVGPPGVVLADEQWVQFGDSGFVFLKTRALYRGQ
ncbi:MAG: FHA domain-containing protein [Myxococcaceae bacterium]|nr:FHA domain-containing protein [Myxococcaceae bacterium]